MYPSGALCRAQEFLKRERSTGAALANVRQVAHKAANASGTEALLAEQREQCRFRSMVVPPVRKPRSAGNASNSIDRLARTPIAV